MYQLHINGVRLYASVIKGTEFSLPYFHGCFYADFLKFNHERNCTQTKHRCILNCSGITMCLLHQHWIKCVHFVSSYYESVVKTSM
jgi:hypothetical protein